MMNSKVKVIILTVLAVGLVAGGCTTGNPDEGPALGKITDYDIDYSQSLEVNKPAPDFQFESPDGEVMFLSDLQGKAVLLNFWQVRCPPCVYEMPYLQAVHDEWSDRGLVLLAINVGESSSTVKRFLESHELSFMVLLDRKLAASRLYSIRAIPTTILIDKDGLIAGYKVGAFQSKEEIEAGIREILP